MIKSLEGIRGIAALIVALYHLKIGADYFSVIRNGYLFVDLFFVLSGFVMYASYASSLSTTADLRSFLIRRIGRLVPLLIFSTLFFVLIANAIVLAKRIVLAAGDTGILNNPDQINFLIPTAKEIITTLTLTHSMGVFDRLILNTPSWSISVEFYAYVLFALLCFLLTPKKRIALFVVFSAFGFAVSVWASVTIHHCLEQKGCMSLTYDFGFVRAVHAFFLGVLASWYGKQAVRQDLERWQLPVLAMLAFLFLVVDAYPAVAFFFPLVFTLLILSLSHDGGRVAHLLKPKMMQTLGQRSYSIYLMHMPLLLLFENVAKRIESVALSIALVAVYVIILYVISGWTYRFIEDPLRTFFNKFASRRSRPVTQELKAFRELRGASPITSDQPKNL